MAVVPVRHPVPARSGAHHRTDRQKTAPPGPQRAGTHGRHGKRARRIAFGHQGHQKLQRHRLYPPQVLRVQRRIFAPDALDGPPPATSLADERIPRPDGRRGTDRLRRFARHERIAFGRRIRRLHRRILADHPPRALVHRPVRQHQSGYRRRRAHLRRARFRTGNPGQARRQDVGRPAREDRIPQCTLLLRRQPGGDRRHLVRHPARRNSGSGRSFGGGNRPSAS